MTSKCFRRKSSFHRPVSIQFGIRLFVFYWISAEIIRFHFVRNTNIAHQPVHTVFPTISFNFPFPLLNFGARHGKKAFPIFSLYLSLTLFNNSIILFAWRAVHTAPMVRCRIRLNLIMPICTHFACATRSGTAYTYCRRSVGTEYTHLSLVHPNIVCFIQSQNDNCLKITPEPESASLTIVVHIPTEPCIYYHVFHMIDSVGEWVWIRIEFASFFAPIDTKCVCVCTRETTLLNRGPFNAAMRLLIFSDRMNAQI